MAMSGRTRLAIGAIAGALLLGAVLISGAGGAQGGVPGDMPAALYEVAYAGPDDNVALRIDGKAVSEAMIRSYVVTYGIGPHGFAGESKTVDDFIARELAVHDVLARGLAGRADAARQVRIFYLSALGSEYSARGLPGRVEISGDEIKSAMPGTFTLGDFDLLVFDSEAEAKKALETIRTGEDFYARAKESPGRLKNTGEIYPASGFFDQFDDVNLFRMKAGDVAGYMETGLGPAVVAVKSVRNLTPGEISQAVDRIKENLAGNKKNVIANSLIDRHRIATDRLVLRGLAEKEVRKGLVQEDDNVVATVDDMPISYVNLRNWISRDYLSYMTGLDPASFERLLDNDLQNLVRQIALGLEAEKERFDLGTGNYARAFDELKRRYYFTVGIRDFMGPEKPVGDKEARKYYSEKRDKLFHFKERVRAVHLYTKDAAKAEKARKEILADGSNFDNVVKRYSDDSAVREAGAGPGVIQNTPAIDETVRSVIFSAKNRKNGVVTDVIKTQTGYHIFFVKEYFPEKTIRFAEARDRIVRTIRSDRFDKAEADYVKSLSKKYKVVKEKAVMDRLAAEFAARGAKAHGGAKGPH